MNIVDIVIILLFVTSLIRGVELGVVRQACSTAGLLVGLFLGAFVQSKLIHLAHTPMTKTLLSLVIIIGFIVVFSSVGEYLGMVARMRLERAKRHNVLDKLDRGVGSVMAGLTLLLVIWLGAAIFNNAPLPAVQREIRSSVIIAQLNKTLPSAPTVVTRLGHLIDPNRFPNVFTGLEPRVNTSAPLPSIGELDSAVQADRASVVKIEGVGCGGVSEGSGFVADNGYVITNAHVVAGVASPYIIDGNGRHSTTVVWFDPNLDMAVLRASDLAGKPLAMAADTAPNGTPSAALGYPGGGDFTAQPASVIDSFKAIGRNIYNQGETARDVYSVKATIRPGNSGGPFIDKNGAVIGIVFAESTTYDQVGYALTINQVAAEFSQAKDQNQTVGTGNCAE
ncbi:MAG TPA: MarP family serine protease [Candidatus Saccharimonadales bacterium]